MNSACGWRTSARKSAGSQTMNASSSKWRCSKAMHGIPARRESRRLGNARRRNDIYKDSKVAVLALHNRRSRLRRQTSHFPTFNRDMPGDYTLPRYGFSTQWLQFVQDRFHFAQIPSGLSGSSPNLGSDLASNSLPTPDAESEINVMVSNSSADFGNKAAVVTTAYQPVPQQQREIRT